MSQKEGMPRGNNTRRYKERTTSVLALVTTKTNDNPGSVHNRCVSIKKLAAHLEENRRITYWTQDEQRGLWRNECGVCERKTGLAFALNRRKEGWQGRMPYRYSGHSLPIKARGHHLVKVIMAF